MKSKNNSYYKYIIILFIASLLFYAVFVTYKYQVGNVEKFNNNTKKVILFYATWCGHCTKYKESGKFEEASQNAPSNVQFVKYDYDQNNELASKYNIQAFPTIILVDETGQLISKFEGDIYDPNALIEFANKSA